jgi:hypothetical protein
MRTGLPGGPLDFPFQVRRSKFDVQGSMFDVRCFSRFDGTKREWVLGHPVQNLKFEI